MPTNVFTTRYHHTDALGTPVVVTGADKSIVETNEYEPYRQLVNRALTDGPGYTGHVQDAATGLTYMQQRYYDPLIGRFLSVDPVTAYSSPSANFNRYWYANNNPYKFTDPDGRQSKEDVKAPTIGVPLLDRLWTPSDARDSTGQMMERQLEFEMSLPQSKKDIVLNVAIAMSLGTGAVGGVAGRGAVRGMARSGAKGASGTLTTTSGNRYHGNSTGSSASGGDARAPMHPQIQKALDGVKNPSRTHGECCEIDAFNKALNAGDDVRGARMGPVKLNESGRAIPACSTCREVKKTLRHEY